MRTFRKTLGNPACLGCVCGLLILCTWSYRSALLVRAGWVLGELVLLAACAGFAVAGYAVRKGERVDRAVRLGGAGSFAAAMVAGACFALMARSVPGSWAAWRGLLIPLVSILPATLVGATAEFGPRTWVTG